MYLFVTKFKTVSPKTAVLLATLALLAACGGGGGESNGAIGPAQATGTTSPITAPQSQQTGTTLVPTLVALAGSTPNNTPPTTAAETTAITAATLTDAQAKAIALVLWRNDDLRIHPKGSCAGCHGADFFDLARIGSADVDIVRRAVVDGASEAQAAALVQAVKALRKEQLLPGTNARTFRPFQPGGSVLLPNLTEAPHVKSVMRDIAFAKSLKTLLPTLTNGRIASLADAQKAKSELLDLANGTNTAGSNPNKHTMRSLPSGIEYPLWSADTHHNAAKEGTFNDWTADIAHDPIPGLKKTTWQGLQNAYLADPGNLNFWTMYVYARNYNPKIPVGDELTAVPLLGACTARVENNAQCAGETDAFNRNKFLSALIGQHMLRLQLIPGKLEEFAQGAVAFSYLDKPEYDSLKKQRGTLNMLPASMWEIGDTALKMINVASVNGVENTFKDSLAGLGYPVFAQNSIDPARLASLELDDLMLSWFWIGTTFDVSMARISKSNATQVGEYMVGILNKRNYYTHNTLANLLRLVAKGYLPEANVTQSGSIIVQGTPKFLMNYGYFWGYGRATLKDTNNRWNEDSKKGITIPKDLKNESTALYGTLAGNGFRMSMYLQMEQLLKTGKDALTDAPLPNTNNTPGQVQQLRDEWLLKNNGLQSMHDHFAEHHSSTLALDDALINLLMTSLGLAPKY